MTLIYKKGGSVSAAPLKRDLSKIILYLFVLNILNQQQISLVAKPYQHHQMSLNDLSAVLQ